jgi:hypothetical protein
MELTADYRNMETALKALKGNFFEPVEYAQDAETAAKIVLGLIPAEARVGVTGTSTIRQLGLPAMLSGRGTKVVEVSTLGEMPFSEAIRKVLETDVLLTSSNSLTIDGKLVNIDGYGNRVGGMVCGPRKVVLVIGVNKLVADVDQAINRVRKVIAPYHAMMRADDTPCATTGICSDCNSRARICNVMSIVEKKPLGTDVAVVLVGADLGLGWDPAWPKERIDKITSTYRQLRKAHKK